MNSTADEATVLEQQAVEFGRQIQDLLQATVCPDARLAYEELRGDWHGHPVGRIGKNGEDFAIRKRMGQPDARLRVYYIVSLDKSCRWLTIKSSGFIIVAAGVSRPVVRWEFDRRREDSFSPAHVHIHADVSDLRALLEGNGRKKSSETENLHFPVGGRRYRPCVEDVIEFLVGEKLADPFSSWPAAVEASRDRYERVQLQAAVASAPLVAIEKLVGEGILTAEEAAGAIARARPRRNLH